MKPESNGTICMSLCRGGCCRGPTYLTLMPEEEEAFRYRAASLGLTVHITRRCDQTAIVPFLKHPGERCPMLDEATSACRIYDDRPQRCRAFPEGPRPGCALADAPTLQGLLSTLCSRPGR